MRSRGGVGLCPGNVCVKETDLARPGKSETSHDDSVTPVLDRLQGDHPYMLCKEDVIHIVQMKGSGLGMSFDFLVGI